MHRPCSRALSRALLPALVAALVTVLLPAPAAQALTATTTSISPTGERLVNHYARVVVAGTLRTAAGKALADRPVEVWRRAPGGAWTKVVTRTTNDLGRVVHAYRATRAFYWKLRAPASVAYAASSSSTTFVRTRSLGASAIREASEHRGKPYQWGAVGPSRFDCSGFTLYVYRQLGRSLPHNSGQQAATVRAVAKSDKRVGDLIFTYNSSGRIYHVGIYAGNGKIWHSPRSGSHVQLSAIFSSRYRVGRLG